MADISISLSNVQNIKTVNIEGVGLLRARRLGAGEELDLSSKIRRLNTLVNELSAMDFMKLDANKPSDYKKIKKMSKRAEEISEEIDEIKRFEFSTYKRCLSDDKNGEVVDVVMNTLNEEERTELLSQIFGKKKKIESPESVSPDESIIPTDQATEEDGGSSEQ